MTHSQESTSYDRWTTAVNAALPRTDDDLVDFLVTLIVDSGFQPLLHDDDDDDDTSSSRKEILDDDTDDDALHSLLSEHLTLLLNKDPQSTTFISRDILDAYRQASSPTSRSSENQHLRPPPRPDCCELCDRPAFLTIHHLFPRSEHGYILAHPPSSLPIAAETGLEMEITKQSLLTTHLAYLCRPCHTAVHRCASNRKLATELYTVELLLEDEAVIKFVGYQSKQRASRVNHSKFGLRYRR